MARLYHRPEWLAFRRQIIEHDEYICQKCGRREGLGVIFQVHHKVYHARMLPWEYDPKECEAVCMGCHAQLHGKIRPSSGWDFLFEEDLGGLDGECEYCGTEIRYVYYIAHSHWDTLAVGTDCCDRLTGSDIAISHRRMLNRRKRFLSSPKWHQEGIVWKITRMHMDFNIDRDDEEFLICFMGVRGKKRFESLEKAKDRLFNFIDSGDARRFKLKYYKTIENQ